MATCAELDSQAKQVATQLAQATVQANNLLKLPIPNTTNPNQTLTVRAQITALSNSINVRNAELSGLINKLNSIQRTQSAQKCASVSYANTLNAANNTLNALGRQSQLLQQTDQNLPNPPTANPAVRPTGNILLTPGDANNLPEVTVIGTRPPQPQLQGTDVNIPTNAGNINIPPPNLNLGQLQGTDVNIPTGPGSAGNIDIAAPNLNLTGNVKPGQDQNLIVAEPVLQGPGPIDIAAPNINLTPEGGDQLEGVDVTATGKPTTQGAVQNTRKQASLRQETNFEARRDWRVKLSLSPGATYLYNDQSNVLLSPLAQTNGVIFPYTPSVQIGYSAAYGSYRPPGSNYAYPYYDSSGIDSISITGEFTAQDNFEANYLLATIHFLRSVTKMFYALDSNPKAGTPPPVLFLTGFGQFMFNNHPLVITNFTYTTPTDVDYIRAGNFSQTEAVPEVKVTAKKPINWNWGTLLQNTIQGTLASGAAAIGNLLNFSKDFNVLTPGGELGQADWTYAGFKGFNSGDTANPTYVPTRMQIQLSAVPVPSRLDVSNFFSLKDYANGKLLSGYNGKGKGAGFW